MTLNNQWVVPYNTYLSNKYEAHLNVEVYGGVQAVKYINSYVYTGGGSITLHVLRNPDKIGQYLTAQYIGSVPVA